MFATDGLLKGQVLADYIETVLACNEYSKMNYMPAMTSLILRKGLGK